MLIYENWDVVWLLLFLDLSIMVNFPGGSEVKKNLGGEDPLEKKMATHSSVYARKNAWTEESGGLQHMG